jgi:hypothetical protein
MTPHRVGLLNNVSCAMLPRVEYNEAHGGSLRLLLQMVRSYLQNESRKTRMWNAPVLQLPVGHSTQCHIFSAFVEHPMDF